MKFLEFQIDVFILNNFRINHHLPLLLAYQDHFLHLRLANLPKANDTLREQIIKKAQAHGWPAMHERLLEVDPVAAARIEPRDKQRIQRALEVHELTGISMTEMLARGTEHRLQAVFRNLMVLPRAREWLHDRIERRDTTACRQPGAISCCVGSCGWLS